MSEYRLGRKWDQEKLSKLVIIWQTSRTIDDVCERMDEMYSSVCAQAAQLRAKGVPMKRFKARPIDYASLKAIAEKHAPAPDAKEPKP